AHQATNQVWQRLSAHTPSTNLQTTVEELKAFLESEHFIDSWAKIVAHTRSMLDAYRTAYGELFDRRKQTYESAIEEIKNRVAWPPLETKAPTVATSLLSPLEARKGTDEDRETVQKGKSLGGSSLTEMESDLAAVDGLKASVVVKLQELSLGSDKKTP